MDNFNGRAKVLGESGMLDPQANLFQNSVRVIAVVLGNFAHHAFPPPPPDSGLVRHLCRQLTTRKAGNGTDRMREELHQPIEVNWFPQDLEGKGKRVQGWPKGNGLAQSESGSAAT